MAFVFAWQFSLLFHEFGAAIYDGFKKKKKK